MLVASSVGMAVIGSLATASIASLLMRDEESHAAGNLAAAFSNTTDEFRAACEQS
jgi:hypothetical protein